jgi:hypothetical protein
MLFPHLSSMKQKITRPGRKCGSLGKTNCDPSMAGAGSWRSPAKHCGMKSRSYDPILHPGRFFLSRHRRTALSPGPRVRWVTLFLVGLGRGSGGKPKIVEDPLFFHGPNGISREVSREESLGRWAGRYLGPSPNTSPSPGVSYGRTTAYFWRPHETLSRPWMALALMPNLVTSGAAPTRG